MFPLRHLLYSVLLIASFDSSGNGLASTVVDSEKKGDSVFLVATEQLNGTAFEQTVILLTHYSQRGATGLTINRPAGISLRKAFPGIRQLQKRNDPLYLGGPVSTNAIFVLLRTDRPSRRMHRISEDIYFATGKHAFAPSSNARETRAYAGYAGWAPGQLKNEISRGDWLMVHTDADIIFEEAPKSLWQRLLKRWKGKWI